MVLSDNGRGRDLKSGYGLRYKYIGNIALYTILRGRIDSKQRRYILAKLVSFCLAAWKFTAENKIIGILYDCRFFPYSIHTIAYVYRAHCRLFYSIYNIVYNVIILYRYGGCSPRRQWSCTSVVDSWSYPQTHTHV